MTRKGLILTGFAIVGMLVLAACGSAEPALIPVTGDENTANLGSPQPAFADVPAGYSEFLGGVPYVLYDHIQALFENGITSGTSANPPMFSPLEPINRAHFAVFLLRSAFGRDYVPTPPLGIFAGDDWTAMPEYQSWAEGLYKAQFTSGCQADPLAFCPSEGLTRLQVAMFALRLKFNVYDGQGNLAVAYEPPPATGGIFADLTDPTFYGTGWAEAAYSNSLLPACGLSGDKPLFCPDDPVNRAWAAYAVVQAKNLLP